MEEHENEVKVMEELVAVLEELCAHFHLSKRELCLIILGLTGIELTFLSFGIISLIIIYRGNRLD